jgi:hypothetical protein
MKKVGLMVALAALAIACSESVGGMMQDAGAMLADAGDVMQPDAGAQDTSVSCDKSETYPPGTETVQRWAEYPINAPGQTEVTICYRGNPDSYGPSKRDTCNRLVSPWYEGTNTGAIHCNGDVKSITVHN